MNRKESIIIFLIATISIIVIMFLGIRSFIYNRLSVPKETISTQEPIQPIVSQEEHITVLYTGKKEKTIEITDQALIKMIKDNVLNTNLSDYSSQIGLVIMGQYTVNLENDISFQFDHYDDNGLVMMYNNGKQFLTKINPEITKKIVDLVDNIQ